MRKAMTQYNRFLTLETLISYPFGNANRGRDGEPKTALWGGVVRARRSSQSCKRRIRETMQGITSDNTPNCMSKVIETMDKLYPNVFSSDRTPNELNAANCVAHQVALGMLASSHEFSLLQITADNVGDWRNAKTEAKPAKSAKGAKGSKKKNQAEDEPSEEPSDDQPVEGAVPEAAVEDKVVRCIYRMAQSHRLSPAEYEVLCHKIHEKLCDEQEMKKVHAVVDNATEAVIKFTTKKRTAADNKESPNNAFEDDVILFGRMVAGNPHLSVDACVSVSHAIGTHAFESEVDFFTAVDDSPVDGENGSAFIGEQAFHANTLYHRYSLNMYELCTNLTKTNRHNESYVRNLLRDQIRAYIESQPMAKKSGTDTATFPGFIQASVKSGFDVSNQEAFEQPVAPDDQGGYFVPSVNRLISKTAQSIASMDRQDDKNLVWMKYEDYALDTEPSYAEKCSSLNVLVDRLVELGMQAYNEVKNSCNIH